MAEILIAGGAGFLGSHLCEKLVGQGHIVKCIDNFITGKIKNIEHLLTNSNFELLEHDVTVPIEVSADQIYNLACPASPIKYQNNPIDTWRSSVLGSLNLLDLARKNSAKILFTSTSEIYGDPLTHPQTETYWGNVNPIGPRACYDESKRAAETLHYDYLRQYQVDIKILRIFNTYGPKMSTGDGRVISTFINQAIDNKNLTIFGTGEHTRSFCYVDDMIDALEKFMNSTFHGPLNFGNPEEISVLDLAKTIINLVNSQSKIEFLGQAKDDPKQRCPDVKLAQNLLGISPSVKLKEGLIKTINYYRTLN